MDADGVDFPLFEASAEHVPLPDANVDCMSTSCSTSAGTRPRTTWARRLLNDYFSLRGFEDHESVGFQLPYGEWIRLFRAHDLTVEDLIELQAPEHGETTYTDYAPRDCSWRWPAEHIWKARREG